MPEQKKWLLMFLEVDTAKKLLAVEIFRVKKMAVENIKSQRKKDRRRHSNYI